jgi:hypothetical protein
MRCLWSLILAAATVAIGGTALLIASSLLALGDSKYQPALNKAKEAALIQSGAQDYIRRAEHYFTDKLYKNACVIVPKEVIQVGSTVGASIYKRQINASFRSPLDPHMRHGLSATTDQVQLITVLEF